MWNEFLMNIADLELSPQRHQLNGVKNAELWLDNKKWNIFKTQS